MVYSYLLGKSLIDFKSNVENKPFTNSKYDSNFNKLDLETSIFNKTNYKNNKVFELDNLFSGGFKLNRYTIEDPEIDYEDDKVFEYWNFISSNLKAACHNLLLYNNCLIEDLNDTINIDKFDIMQFNLSFKLVAIDTSFMINAVN